MNSKVCQQILQAVNLHNDQTTQAPNVLSAIFLRFNFKTHVWRQKQTQDRHWPQLSHLKRQFIENCI